MPRSSDGYFEDPAWVERWDVVFADLYLDALDADLAGSAAVPRPWRLAFDAPPSLPPLRHVLLGINAHINYDLPQALLAVISDEEFADPALLDRRRRDHERIDGVLAARVAAEDDELAPRSARSLLDRLLHAAEPAELASASCARRDRRCGTTRRAAARPRGRPGGVCRAAGASSRCSAPPGSPTCSRRDRCCCGWPSPGSG